MGGPATTKWWRPCAAAGATRYREVKQFLGGLSFIFMMIGVSERQQAIHDAVAAVTVRIKDESLARRRDYVRGRRQALAPRH